MKTFLRIFIFMLCVCLKDSFAQTWTQIAHGSKLDTTWAGAVEAIVEITSGTYLAATDAGVYRSIDDGISWEPFNMSISSSYPITLYAHPDGRIFCGTWLGGLFVSSDNGFTWNHVAGHPNLPIQRIIKDSQGRMFTGLWPLTRIGGVCRSTDNGTTWTQVLDSLYVEDVEIGPGDVLFAGAGQGSNWKDVGGLWRSTDSGATWESIYDSIGVRSVTVTADGTILMGGYYWDPNLQLHTYRSTDNGRTWAQCSNFYSEFFATDANQIVYAACDAGLRKSTDNGVNWETLNSGMQNRNGDVPWLRCLYKVGENGFIAGEYHTGEIFKSTDLGAHWSTPSALLSIQYISGKLAAIAPKEAGKLFIGSAQYGMLRWENAEGLVSINSGLGNLMVQTVYVGSTGDVFAGTIAGVYRSTNNGDNWIKFGTPAVIIKAITELPSGEILGGTTVGVIRFAPDGSTYTSMNTGLTNKNVNTLYSGTDGRCFVGTGNDLYKLDNTTWIPMNVSSGNLKVVDIKVDEQTIAIATRDSSVYVTNDNGQIWQKKQTGIDGYILRGLVFVKPDQLYVVTEQNGIFSATTGSIEWTSFVQGLNDLNMRGIVLSNDGYLYAITDSGAVFKTMSPVPVQEEDSNFPTVYALAQNYPNPFNPSTIISYSIPKSSQVIIKIFNTLGEEIETLVKEEKYVGTYEVNWNGANLPSGVYFYRVQAGDFTSVKKMILLK